MPIVKEETNEEPIVEKTITPVEPLTPIVKNTTQQEETRKCPRGQNTCYAGSYHYCASACAVTSLFFDSDFHLHLERDGTRNPIVDIVLSQGQPCVFNSEQPTDTRRQNYLLYMPGWKTGCEKEIQGVSKSQDFTEVDNSPDISEYDLVQDNGLEPQLEKLINFRIPKLKDYQM